MSIIRTIFIQSICWKETRDMSVSNRFEIRLVVWPVLPWQFSWSRRRGIMDKVNRNHSNLDRWLCHHLSWLLTNLQNEIHNDQEPTSVDPRGRSFEDFCLGPPYSHTFPWFIWYPLQFFVWKFCEGGTLKQCPPIVIKTMMEDTDHELQGSNSRGAQTTSLPKRRKPPRAVHNNISGRGATPE